MADGSQSTPVVKIEGVSVKYRLAREKPATLQEYLIKRLKGWKVSYEDFWALRGVDVSLCAGETLGVIGHNGAGKSTLLKVVAGIMKPTEGRISTTGKIAPLIELGAGFSPDLTGIENIYLNASILGLSRREIKDKVKRIVDFSELHEFIHSPLKSYSSGMVARLGFSIATEVEPKILIVDEILTVGDEHFKKKCDERMMDFRAKGVSMIFVSHALPEVRKLCTKVLWLDHGKAMLCGDPELVTEEYLKVAG